MAQQFYLVPIDGDYFFCEETYCEVYIYMQGEYSPSCPGCQTVGVIVTRYDYPPAPEGEKTNE